MRTLLARDRSLLACRKLAHVSRTRRTLYIWFRKTALGRKT